MRIALLYDRSASLARSGVEPINVSRETKIAFVDKKLGKRLAKPPQSFPLQDNEPQRKTYERPSALHLFYLLLSHVQDVSQGITEKVDTEDCERDGQAGKDRQPPTARDKSPRVAQDQPPGGRSGLHKKISPLNQQLAGSIAHQFTVQGVEEAIEQSKLSADDV